MVNRRAYSNLDASPGKKPRRNFKICHCVGLTLPQGIHVGFVRVLRLNVPQRLADSKSYGGCRSWLDLPAMDDIARVPVISDEEHQSRKKRLEQILRPNTDF